MSEGYVTGAFLDAAILKLAKDIVAMDNASSVMAIDVNGTVKKWNDKHSIVSPEKLAKLQNDVSLGVEFQKNRQLKSMNAGGLAEYTAERYVEQAVEKFKNLTTPPFFEENLQNG